MKDYEIEIKYHQGKANVVADALSQKSVGSTTWIITSQGKVVRELAQLQIEAILPGKVAK